MGTVTFLFTDIEGSTRRWESDSETMRSALAAHDAVLRSAVEAHGGWLFKHTGDGVCAAFSAADDAVAAAVDAQRRLGLPVRMGISTGSAELRGEDYFGPPLNRAARVMAVGHGGQILMAASTASLLDRVDLVDLGEHRLRDLSGAYRLFQVRADGISETFPPLRTSDAVPGNLPVQATSLVGREVELIELAELVRAHRMVTLVGVGGVGKTRLAVQVAAELTGEFPDGVWLVELAPVRDPGMVPEAAATALGVTPQAAESVTARVAEALSGRRLLVVLDNCEHVLDAAAELVEMILIRAPTVNVLATSREGLRVDAEHLWPVPSLDVRAGTASAAVKLFVERAQAVSPAFALASDADASAVIEVCRRLDGVALAIELAAARMVSMSPTDVRDRLGERFRLLAGGRRGLERHQTLRHAVAWSYDLLGDDERTVLHHSSVFADGFDLAAAAYVCENSDEYAMLDLLDSLVRKSLVTVQRSGRHARYGMLETIRQFAEGQLAVTGGTRHARGRHAHFYAEQVIARWDIWDGPRQREALDWVDVEFANLRTGFRWATDHGDVPTATAIAANATMLALALQRYESVGWAEEILPAAVTADVRHLPRLYAAASVCTYIGRPEAGVSYAQAAVRLTYDLRYEAFPVGWSRFCESLAHRYAGRPERTLAILAEVAGEPGPLQALGRAGQTHLLAWFGRGEEARAIADDALAAAWAHGNPYVVAWALHANGLAYADTDPARALNTLRQGLDYARDHRLLYWEARIAREAAVLEALDGDLDRALALFDDVIDALHQAGNVATLAAALAHLAVVFDRIDRPRIAAVVYGASTRYGVINTVTKLPNAVDHLRAALDGTGFTNSVAVGAAMEPAVAVRYIRDQIRLVRAGLGVS